MNQEVWKELEHIDKLGGSVSAIETHYFQDAIAKEAYRYQREIEANDRVIVGVNMFHIDEKGEPPVLKVDPSLEVKQRESLAKLRRERDNSKVGMFSPTGLRQAQDEYRI